MNEQPKLPFVTTIAVEVTKAQYIADAIAKNRLLVDDAYRVHVRRVAGQFEQLTDLIMDLITLVENAGDGGHPEGAPVTHSDLPVLQHFLFGLSESCTKLRGVLSEN